MSYWYLPALPVLWVLAGPPVAFDLMRNWEKPKASQASMLSVIFGQWRAFFASDQHAYDVKLALAQASTVAASVFFAGAVTVLVATAPTSSRNWGLVTCTATALAVASALQVQCGFARAVIYQGGKSFFEAAGTASQSFNLQYAMTNAPAAFKGCIGIVNLATQASYYWMFRFSFLLVAAFTYSVYNSVTWVSIAALIVYEVLAGATVHCIYSNDDALKLGLSGAGVDRTTFA